MKTYTVKGKKFTISIKADKVSQIAGKYEFYKFGTGCFCSFNVKDVIITTN